MSNIHHRPRRITSLIAALFVTTVVSTTANVVAQSDVTPVGTAPTVVPVDTAPPGDPAPPAETTPPTDTTPADTTPAGPAPSVPDPLAATATLLVSVVPLAADVLSGEVMTWTVSWSCSSDVEGGTCDGAQIVMPIPVSAPSSIAVWPSTASSITPSTGGFTTSQTVTNTEARWVFTPSLAAGTSGQMNLSLRSKNMITPDGDTYTPIATFTATNASAAVSDPAPTAANPAGSTVTVNSSAALSITKTRYPATAPEPAPGQNVTYVVTYYPTNNARPIPKGTWWFEALQLTDTLPATATFASASYRVINGSPQTFGTCSHSGSTPGGTVTCPVTYDRPEYAGDIVDATRVEVFITVTYPTTQPASGTPLNQADDGVTNAACATGTPYGGSEADEVTSCASTTHGFVPTGTTGLFSFSKAVRGVRQTSPGGAANWDMIVRSTYSTPVEFTYTDHLPCPLTSPTSGTGCTPQAQVWGRLQSSMGYFEYPITIDYTLSDGSTGSATFPAGVAYLSQVDAPAGLGFTDYTVSGTLPPGGSFGIVGLTTTALTVPTTAIPGTTYVEVTPPAGNTNSFIENCLSAMQARPVGAASWTNYPTGINQCDWQEVIAPAPVIQTAKIPTNDVQSPGGVVHFRLTTRNSGTAPMTPTVSDLLPANLRVVPGSVVTSGPLGTSATVEVIDNYNGTGRQLLRLTWPGTTMPISTVQYVDFDATVQPGTPAGVYTNRSGTTDPLYPNAACAPVANRGTDSDDLDGDGNTTEPMCFAEARYTVLAGASLLSSKLVQGDLDSAPSTDGRTGGGTSTYTVTLTNSGNLALSTVVGYDILPAVGDTTAGPVITGRLSTWTPTFIGNVQVPAGTTVQYSTSSNPCRGEVLSVGGATGDGPAGCVNNWGPAPSNLADVKALRFVYTGALAGGDSLVIRFDVDTPAVADGAAWNSVSMAGQRSDTSGWLQPAESPKVKLVPVSDLELTKTIVSAVPQQAGGQVTYRLTLTNKGPASGVAVTVADLLPAGLSFASASPSVGTYDDATGLWTVGDLAASDTVTLDIVANINLDAPATMTNQAQVAHNKQQDVDSTGGNMPTSPHEDDETEVSFQVLAPTGSIGDHVWFDIDGDGVVDAGEPGIPGALVTVTWLGFDGVAGGGDDVVFQATTDSDGNYVVDKLPVGAFTVAISNLPVDAHLSYDADGGDLSTTSVVLTAAQQTRTDVDFGVGVKMTLGDMIFNDINADGIYTAGTDTAAPDVTVELYDAAGVLVRTMTTVGGMYSFDGLAPGDYYIVIPSGMFTTVLAGYAAALDGQSDPNVLGDQDIDHNGYGSGGGVRTGLITLSAHIEAGANPGDPAVIVGDEPDGLTNATLDIGVFVPVATLTVTNFVVPNNDPASADDANTAPGPGIINGGTASWSYTVTNTGNVPFPKLVLTDDNGTPADPSDDWAPIPVLVGSYNQGDANQDGIFDPGEVWIYTTPPSRVINVLGTETVASNVTATGTTGIPAAPRATASDPANFHGIKPGVQILKTVQEVYDAETAPGPYFVVGDPVLFSYLVTVTGTAPLTAITVTDDKIVDDASIRCSYGTDTDDNVIAGPVEPGEEFLCTIVAQATAGQYTNIGTVTAVGPVQGAPGSPVGGEVISARNAGNYFGSQPGVTVVKKVNGEDANTLPGVTVGPGSTMNFTYEVRNTGNVVLSAIAMSDDKGVVVTCPAATLPVGQTMTCTGSGRAPASGTYTNVGTVSAHGPDTVGPKNETIAGKVVNATDTANATINATGGGDVPVTGGQVAGITTLAGLLAAGGWLLVVAGRRRRQAS